MALEFHRLGKHAIIQSEIFQDERKFTGDFIGSHYFLEMVLDLGGQQVLKFLTRGIRRIEKVLRFNG